MDDITKDLPGVAVYLDDILVSRKSAEDYLHNLKQLLQRLSENGLRCRKEKCEFAKPCVESFGHILSQNGISKGSKVDEVMDMLTPLGHANTQRCILITMFSWIHTILCEVLTVLFFYRCCSSLQTSTK